MCDKWNKRFLKIAEDVAEWSKDPSTQVGAVIVGNQKQILSQGFNGFARGIMDYPQRYENRELKYKYIVHAEANAIYNAIHNGASTLGSTIYVHGLPVCHECAKAIIQAGIKKVVYNTLPDERWKDSASFAINMMCEAGVIVEFHGE